MGDGIEALGALTTAGLVAHEVDRPTVRQRLARVAAARFGRPAPAVAAAADHDAPHATHGATCANCDTALVGDFCHACGQSAHVHRSVGHVFEEFLHGVWHFDSKAWRTLPLLVFRPGKLTSDYVHGRRARFVAPLAMFLFSIFLMFFVFGFVGAPDLNGALDKAARNDDVANARAEVDDARAEITGSTTDLKTAIAEADADDRRAAEADLAKHRAALAAAEAALAKAQASSAANAAKPAEARYKNWQDYLAENARAGKLNANTGVPSIDANVKKALLNPEFALYRVEQKAYKLSFLLVPLSLPFLWLLFFWRRDVTLYDHTVFALYSLSFMSLLFVFAVVLMKAAASVEAIGGPVLGSTGLLFLVPLVHMFAQLKGGYRLSTWGALWRTLVLSQLTVLVLATFVALIIVVGLAD